MKKYIIMIFLVLSHSLYGMHRGRLLELPKFLEALAHTSESPIRRVDILKHAASQTGYTTWKCIKTASKPLATIGLWVGIAFFTSTDKTDPPFELLFSYFENFEN